MTAIDLGVPSLAHLFLDRVAASPLEVAYETREGLGWRTWGWEEIGQWVQEVSAGLNALGLEPGQCGAVLAGTRLEWIVCDLAILCTGLSTTTLYPSSTAADCAFMLEDADARVVFVEDSAQYRKICEVRSRARGLEHVVLIEGEAEGALTLHALQAMGVAWLAEHGHEAWSARARSAGPEDLATLIYTSGTTGLPKGVRLVHDCWLAQAEALAPVMQELRHADDKLYVWLPLAHSYGKVLQLAGIAYGMPSAIDGDLNRLAESLADTRPTWVPAVPRVFEKMHSKISASASDRGERAAKVFAWARAVAIEVSERRRAGQALSLRLRLSHRIADRLVYRSIRQAFGGRIRGFLSGSAPLSSELQHFFDGVGLPILEGYGLTECAAVATGNTPDETRFGSVGQCSGPTEVRISEEGEVLLRGRTVMRGYHNRPKDTAAVMRDGWFHTGDLGRIDDQGYLHITGRIKELIITSGGKNIAPAPIEHAIKALCPALQEVVMVGDRQRFCVALVTIDPDLEWDGHGHEGRYRSEVQAAVDRVNATLASYQTIKAFAILEQSFSIEGGELTPSQKVKRAVVQERYADLLDSMFAET